MRIVIVGADGQLGQSLLRRAEGHSVVGLELVDHDICDLSGTHKITASQPDVIVNAAALTDVDGCEGNPDIAFLVHAIGARNVALAAASIGAAMVQVSTDYVFDGKKSEPYWEFDTPSPVNVYGASKLAGEQLVKDVWHRVFVVRTAWLYGLGGNHFVKSILRLADEHDELSIVDNEFGSPTFCDDLSDAMLQLIETRAFGTYHLCGEGACSRYEFAKAILEEAGRADVSVKPIDHYPRRAQPPAYAPMRNFAAAQLGVRMPHWREGLTRFFERSGGQAG
jgi:dTDP-4-dehydrorhamnose reductase